MEITIAWFWLIKVLGTGLLLLVGYKAIKSKSFKSSWSIIFYVLIILTLVNPIKIGVETRDAQSSTNYKISQQKELPEMVKDDSFSQAGKLQGISKEDLK